jgi:hypothetical protein
MRQLSARIWTLRASGFSVNGVSDTDAAREQL